MEIISNRLGLLTNRFQIFITMISNLLGNISDFFSSIGGIVSALWFGLTTLFNGVWDLIVEVFEGTLFSYVVSAFDYVSNYLGTSTTLFISTLLFVIIVRIGIAFVFKMLRLNIDYHNTSVKTKTLYQHSKLK